MGMKLDLKQNFSFLQTVTMLSFWHLFSIAKYGLHPNAWDSKAAADASHSSMQKQCEIRILMVYGFGRM